MDLKPEELTDMVEQEKKQEPWTAAPAHIEMIILLFLTGCTIAWIVGMIHIITYLYRLIRGAFS